MFKCERQLLFSFLVEIISSLIRSGINAEVLIYSFSELRIALSSLIRCLIVDQILDELFLGIFAEC